MLSRATVEAMISTSVHYLRPVPLSWFVHLPPAWIPLQIRDPLN
jgi:hypothetical protein